MNNKMKYVFGILLMLFSIGSLQAQTTEKTTQCGDNDSIVMPKDEFVDVVAKAVKERRKKNAKLEAIQRYKLELLMPNSKKEKVDKGYYIPTMEDNYERRFNRLEDQLQMLMLMLAINNNASGNAVNYLPKPATAAANESYLHLLDNVNKLKDEAAKDTTILNADNSALEQEIARLVAETERLKDKIHANQPTQVQKSQYDGQTSEVFFANAKYNLSNEAIATIDKVVSLLKNDPELDVMVKGFASKVGNPIYNQNLSLKRSDNVKQALISKGIAPGRVLTTYHGEDFSNRSEAESRRVDIIILDRRK